MNKLTVFNGKIYVEKGVYAQALWSEDGIICGVGSNEDIPAEFRSGEMIDCQGRTVIPGLNDSHMHLIKIGTRMGQVKLAGSASVGSVVPSAASVSFLPQPGRRRQRAQKNAIHFFMHTPYSSATGVS